LLRWQKRRARAIDPAWFEAALFLFRVNLDPLKEGNEIFHFSFFIFHLPLILETKGHLLTLRAVLSEDVNIRDSSPHSSQISVIDSELKISPCLIIRSQIEVSFNSLRTIPSL